MSCSPPRSLDCREFLRELPSKYADYGQFLRFLIGKSDCEERTSEATKHIKQESFSEAALFSPTLIQGKAKLWRSQV